VTLKHWGVAIPRLRLVAYLTVDFLQRVEVSLAGEQAAGSP
jgi:hypothetical protein